MLTNTHSLETNTHPPTIVPAAVVLLAQIGPVSGGDGYLGVG